MIPERIRPHLLILLFLLFVTALAYERVLSAGFITLDDNQYVTENPMVLHGLNLEGIRWAWTSGYAANWHPLTWISHMLDIEIFGRNPAGHHLVSLLFHLANTLLLFVLLMRMTGAFGRSVLVAALFALHPLHVESVAWVAERKDVLSSFFGLLTIWAYLRYADSPGFIRFLPVVFLFTLGLLSKPMLVTLPFVLLLLDYWPLKREESELRFISEKIPLFTLSIVSSIITFLVQRSAGAVARSVDVPPAIRLGNALVSYVRYLLKLMWPSDLAVFYPHPYLATGKGWSVWQVAGAGLLLFLICLGALRFRRRVPYFTVGWFWFFGTLVPVIGLIQVGHQAMADRYTYFPSIGFFIVAVWGISDLLRSRFHSSWISIGGSVLVIAFCAGLTWKQTGYWKNSRTLYRHTLEVTENNWEIHNNLGNVLIRAGAFDRAIEQFQTILKEGRNSVAFRPEDLSEIHYNIGLAYGSTGRIDQAVNHYKAAVDLNPENLDAWNNLGSSYFSEGLVDQAISVWEKILWMAPGYATVYFNLGEAYLKKGVPGKAISSLHTFLRYHPDSGEAFYLLGEAYETMGDSSRAESCYRKVLRLQPLHRKAKQRLAVLNRAEGGSPRVSHTGKKPRLSDHGE